MTTMYPEEVLRRGLDRFQMPLASIPPDCPRDEWIKVGMALHHESDGSDEGLAMWHEWSAAGISYDECELVRQWKSFKSTSSGVTGGTILKLARQYGYRNGSLAAKVGQKELTAKAGPAPNKTDPPWADVEYSLTKKGHKITVVYGYVDESGTLLAEKVRFSPKTFRWRHECNGRLFSKQPRGVKLPPYGLLCMLQRRDEIVFIVEGEKDADRLQSEHLVAVSIESKHESTAAEYLANRDVVILPDNDYYGQTRAKKVADALRGKARSVLTIALPDLPVKGDVSDWLDSGHTIADLHRLVEETRNEEPFVSLDEAFTLFDAVTLNLNEEYLVEDILPVAGIGLFYAPTGMGKTFVAVDLGMSVALGKPFANKYETQRGSVVLVALEAPTGVKKRLVAYQRKNGVTSAPFALLDYPIDLRSEESAEGLISLLENFAAFQGTKPCLVIIDTLAKAMPGADENSSADTGKALSALQKIQRVTSGCVMAIHHTGKDEGRGARGHSALNAGSDFVLAIKGKKSELYNELFIEKLKDGPDGVSVASFQLDELALGNNRKNREITSAVVNWLDAESASRNPSLTDAEQKLLSHYDELVRDGNFKSAEGQSGIPKVAKCVKVASLVDRSIGAEESTDRSKRKSIQSGIDRNIRKLRDKGILGRIQGKVWRIND